jgi:L-fuconolactonase
MKLADAHIHLFPRGYHRPDAPSLFGEGELQAYEALHIHHDIDLALAIAYEGDGGDPDNNAHLRRLAPSRGWLKTLAFAAVEARPDPSAIEGWLEAGHHGLAIYALDRAGAEAVLNWPEDIWRMLQARRAIVSLNSRPEAIAILAPLVARWRDVAFLFSHLGLPGVAPVDEPPKATRERLRPLLNLAPLPNAHVKISGVYATSDPAHAYPHAAAHDAIACILNSFGPRRCLWASDFAPALEYVSFPQTLDWPGNQDLTEEERRLVYGENLRRLLSAV